MNVSEVKIAYVPYGDNFDTPADRRRFIFYASERKIEFERADSKCIYDIVYLTYGCDLGVWIDYKRRNPSVKIIFELIDSYLLQRPNILTLLKGPIRYILGYESKFFLNYKSALHEVISLSDAVVCSTELQKNDLLYLNKNIHVSLDYFGKDISLNKKNNYKVGEKIKLVWEGQPYWAKNLLLLNDIFKNLEYDFEIKILTDRTANYYLGLRKLEVSKILSKLKCQYEFIEWNRETFVSLISDCDLALIPIDPSDSFSINKPENKLLFFWEVGIPVLTSDIPAYKRVMDMAGIDWYCTSELEWCKKIENFFKSDENLRKEISSKASSYLDKFHSKDLILAKWDLIFNSL